MTHDAPRTQTVAVGPIRLHVTQRGEDGQPVAVLLHGGGSRSRTWQRFAVALARAGWRVIAPDLRGHGASSRAGSYPLAGYGADITGLLDAWGLDEVALVGHSLGGYAAARIAQEQPERVTRLVLEEPPAPPREGALMAAPPTRRLLLALSTLSPRRRYDRRALVSAVAQLRRPDPRWWDKLPSISAPTLVLSGGPASHLPPARLAEMAQAIPDARLVTIPVGHRVHSKAPERFAEHVLPFLAGAGAGEAGGSSTTDAPAAGGRPAG